MVVHLCVSVGLFFVYLIVLSVSGVKGGTYAVLALTGLVVIGLHALFTQIALIRLLKKRNMGALQSFQRFLDGNLTLSAEEIREHTKSKRMGLGMVYLSQGIFRLLSRFGNVASSTGKTAEQLVSVGNTLSRTAMEGAESLDITAEAVENVYQTQTTLHESIERLSVAGEDTSSSILQMGASLEEVTRFAHVLHEHVDRVNVNIDTIFESIKALGDHVGHLTSFSSETSTSMLQMSASIAEVDRHSQATSREAEVSKKSAMEGKDQIKNMVKMVEGVHEAMVSIQATMDNLQGQTRRIDSVVGVISDITKQTNLLALNAAIIAAQGKERGKGFAVVADEIRDLSERTAHSTEEIQSLVTGIQKVVDDLAGQLDGGMQKITFSVNASHQASAKFDDIAHGLQAALDALTHIARMTREQTSNSDAVASAVEEVSQRLKQMNQNIDQLIEKTGVLREASTRILEGVNHILRSTEEQKKGSTVIQEAVNNIKQGIDALVDASNYITGSSQKIIAAIGNLKETVVDVTGSASGLKTFSENIFTSTQHFSGIVNEYNCPAPRHGGVIRCHIPWKGEYGFDPLTTQHVATSYVTKHIYETLVDFTTSTLPEPLLAESWEVENGGKRYTFHLKPGVFFHNGREMVSRDVSATFHRGLHPRSPSKHKSPFSCIEGCEEFMEGRATEIKGIEVPDDHRIVFHLRQPFALFPTLLSLNELGVVPEEDLETYSRGSGDYVGTGPFRLTELTKDRVIRLEKNTGYHVPEHPYVEEVAFRIHRMDVEELLRSLDEGTLNMVLGVSPAEVMSYMREGYFSIRVPTLRTSFLAFNMNFEPLQNERVRQALNIAVDLDRINAELYHGQNTPAGGILPPALQTQSRFSGWLYHPDKARDMLKEAGYASGLRMQLWVPEGEDLGKTPIPHILKDFAEVNVFVDVERIDPGELQRRRSAGEQSPLYLTGWYADYPDPDSFFSSLFLPDTDSVNLHYDNPDIAARIHAASIEADMRKRQTLYVELNHLIHQEAPVLFLFHPPEYVVYHPSVSNVLPAIIAPFIRFSNVWRQY